MDTAQVVGLGAGLPSTSIGLAIEKGETGTAMAIHVSERADSVAVWTFQVMVQTNEGERILGSFTTRPPAGGDPPARVVCLCFCPGAKDWRVEIQGPVNSTCSVSLTSSAISVAGVFGLVGTNGTRIDDRQWPAPAFAVGQGILSPGPGTLYAMYGFTDPAQPLTFVGPVDKAAAVVGGDRFLVAPVQIPAGGANFSFSFEPRGLFFFNQIRWAASGAPDPIALGPAATVQGEVG